MREGPNGTCIPGVLHHKLWDPQCRALKKALASPSPSLMDSNRTPRSKQGTLGDFGLL